MTQVMDMSTGKIVAGYNLPPAEAVRCAFIQFKLKDFSTWNYAIINTPPLITGRMTVSCGDYCAFTDDKLNAALNA